MWVCRNREDNIYVIGYRQMAHEPMRISARNWNLDLDEGLCSKDKWRFSDCH